MHFLNKKITEKKGKKTWDLEITLCQVESTKRYK